MIKIWRIQNKLIKSNQKNFSLTMIQTNKWNRVIVMSILTYKKYINQLLQMNNHLIVFLKNY